MISREAVRNRGRAGPPAFFVCGIKNFFRIIVGMLEEIRKTVDAGPKLLTHFRTDPVIKISEDALAL